MSDQGGGAPPGAGQWVPITAFSAEELVRDGIFTFEPPYLDRSPRAEAFFLQWRAIQTVFPDITDPRSFPPLPDAPEGEERELFERYIAAAEEMAESQLLVADDQMTVRIDDETGEEHVEASFTSKEITRGFAVLLRQFDAKDEEASFQRVSGRLRKLSMETTDGHADTRCQQIDAWRKAQGKLHATELRRLAIRAIEPAMEYGNQHPPTYYLSAYNYGELIHWGSGKDVLAQWETDPFHKHHERLAFLEAALGLAHLYMGFGLLVDAALGR